jgi:ABC-type glycerol-3-phosphate transport system substrate-binding protein
MKSAAILASLLALGVSACGADVAATAVTVTELQAENAKQAKKQMEQIQKSIDETQQLSQRRLEESDAITQQTEGAQ